MKILTTASLASLIACTAALAAQETRPKSLFRDMTCEEVSLRSEAIMLERQVGGIKVSSIEYLAHTQLDRVLIDDAYLLPHEFDSGKIFEAIQDFGIRWREICAASTSN